MVKCQNCGLLAVRLKSDRALVEVEQSARETGRHEPPAVNDRFTTGFHCCANAADLHGLTGHKNKFEHHQGVFNEGLYKAKCREELQKDRQCDDFIAWSMGFSPKEHIEMGLIAEQRRLTDEALENERNWREKQAAKEDQWRRDEAQRSKDALSQSNRQHLVNLIVFGVLITIVTAAAQVFAALVERGVIFP